MEQNQLSFADYMSVIRRRLWVIVGTFVLVAASSITLAVLLPPTYESTGTILIESQQIPTDLVQAAVTSYADERIEVIKQRVMTRENLLKIINKYKLFVNAGPTITPSEQIDEIRKGIAVELVNANVKPNQKGSGTIAFRVSFEHRRPEVAQGVANDLVTLFLDENVKARTERASQTTEFLTQEAERLKQELDKLETQIATYKQDNSKALPENATLGMAAMQRVETDLRSTDGELSRTQEELRTLENERQTAATLGVPAPAPVLTPENLELKRARSEVARLSSVYTESHPDLKAAKRRLETLEKEAEADVPKAAQPRTASPADSAIARIDGRIALLRDRSRALSGQQGSLRARLSQMEAQMVRSPQVERGLSALSRDYDIAKKKYDEINAKKLTARVAENLEGDQKAERFALLEPAMLPDKPIKPNRKKMIAMGLLLALVSPIALVMLLEAVQGTVRGIEAVTAIVGHKPLVTIPLIPVVAEIQRRKRLAWKMTGAAAVACCAALVAVHFLYLPLDLLWAKVLVRIS